MRLDNLTNVSKKIFGFGSRSYCIQQSNLILATNLILTTIPSDGSISVKRRKISASISELVGTVTRAKSTWLFNTTRSENGLKELSWWRWKLIACMRTGIYFVWKARQINFKRLWFQQDLFILDSCCERWGSCIYIFASILTFFTLTSKRKC